MKVGVITTFYKYQGDVFDRVKQLATIFTKINKQPYIQINAGKHMKERKNENRESVMCLNTTDEMSLKFAVSLKCLGT